MALPAHDALQSKRLYLWTLRFGRFFERCYILLEASVWTFQAFTRRKEYLEPPQWYDKSEFHSQNYNIYMYYNYIII